MRHFPFMWRFRLLRALHAKGNRENRRLLGAWARAEGGTARYNPLNTTQPWPGATDYNSAHVKNYATGQDGIAATATTLRNGHYNGIVSGMVAGVPAREIVTGYGHEFDVWGTGAANVLRLL